MSSAAPIFRWTWTLSKPSRAEHDAKLLFVCSPNNPDGSLIAPETLERLLDLPLVVVLDEAYIEFSGAESMAARVPRVRQPDRAAHVQQVGRAGRAARRLRHLSQRT